MTINGFINTSSPGLNITGITNINFYVGTQLSKINSTDLSVFHTATFPYTYGRWCNVPDRLSSLSQCMNGSPEVFGGK